MRLLAEELDIDMNAKVKTQSQNQPLQTSGNDNQNFDFELWARAVRPQLLAAIQRHSGGRSID
ncbi:MAG: hypothetical protein JOZ78_19230 [Chroococcidiopsidaceae cyanobacterium CP_BM_ER_R8_30]|nr:hypothetical protein [Chroococcidiopsidaceae cyanobacterium CP_BM_ER_R8_30]